MAPGGGTRVGSSTLVALDGGTGWWHWLVALAGGTGWWHGVVALSGGAKGTTCQLLALGCVNAMVLAKLVSCCVKGIHLG